MASESWFKISLPAYPLAFTVFGVWLYWGENPVPLLPPSIAFWGLVILFYLFTHVLVENRRYPLFMTIASTVLWLVASITSHNLANFFASGGYSGPLSVIRNKDFWYAYVCALFASAAAMANFVRFEPLIVAESQKNRDLKA